ncbi:unnamed protein product [Lepeophtheirus salmonis]|uniref:(salmon louse) hypothetical protein n=1 Tax=Lepeophtheirus salmonis TaxID=72036 RepID=A0A7R8CG63_LEPSM|nr:unnamed protein product [Lepeophtheirus salmonis]CAF2772991.1 unnamed protein product [Lepeophtheirus salmonis]
MMGRDLNESWIDFEGGSSVNNYSLLTSSALEDDEHDITFAPPNSPIVPSNVVMRGTINIPSLDQTLNAEDPEGASPIVRGVFDSTWFPYSNYENCPVTPDANQTTNQFLNESNMEILHNSLLESKWKPKDKIFVDLNNTLDEKDNIDYNSTILANNNNNNSSVLEPMFQIFRDIKSGDSHLSHIISNIKRLLSNKMVSHSDVCADDFVKKSAELFQTSTQFDDIAIFHLVSLFEQVLSDSELSKDRLKLISQYCRSPLAKLAMAGNPEISKRAENFDDDDASSMMDYFAFFLLSRLVASAFTPPFRLVPLQVVLSPRVFLFMPSFTHVLLLTEPLAKDRGSLFQRIRYFHPNLLHHAVHRLYPYYP